MNNEPGSLPQNTETPQPLGQRSLRRRPKKRYGVYPAHVIDIQDPEGLGRVEVRLPWQRLSRQHDGMAWARLATLMAGDGRGSWFIPEVGDEVLVAFEGGDPSRPYVLGSLWSAQDTPPAAMDGAGDNPLKLLRTRSGLQITLLDQPGQAAFILETPGGQKITLQDGPGIVLLTDSNGNSIRMEPSGITIQASAKLTLSASTLEISAGMVSVNAGTARFSGVTQTDTLIANSVISASYSPGAGNIW
jgi:uncharacterized protein involved in type VI secretion and phage assembly